MFNKNFYPTPIELVERMIEKFSFCSYSNGIVLEPSAGKGDIIEVLNNKCPDIEIHSVEKEEDLRVILSSKKTELVGKDFLKFVPTVEYDGIIANPPFDNGDLHLLKMIQIAENQYESTRIVCLLNAETIKNPYSNSRKVLLEKLEKYNADIEYIENAFSNAERKTNVEVALVSFTVNNLKEYKSYYEYIFSKCERKVEESTTTELSTVLLKNELGFSLDEIDRLILMYNKTIELNNKYKDIVIQMESLDSYLSEKEDIYVGFTKEVKSNKEITVKFWRELLLTDKFSKYLTEKSRTSLYNKIKQLGSIAFTKENIENVLLSLIRNVENIFTEVIVDFFKEVTSYNMNEYSKNIHYYNGWKTNSGYLMNSKIILPTYVSYYWTTDYNEQGNGTRDLDYKIVTKMNEFKRVLSILNGGKESSDFKLVDFSTFENELLKFKVFKKGTIHIWFKDLDLLNRLNLVAGQFFNWLPTDEEIKTDKNARAFVKEIIKDVKLLGG